MRIGCFVCGRLLIIAIARTRAPNRSNNKNKSTKQMRIGRFVCGKLLIIARTRTRAANVFRVLFLILNCLTLVQDIIGAGSDTTPITIEWAMAELIRNPEKMKRAQAEVEEVVGRKRMVEESDAERLPYLRAVVKEVFRLHPAVSLLIPYRADGRCEIAGFEIPKNTQIIVNAWAIGRDPSIWKEAEKFMTERFIEKELSSMDYKGQDLELIPFGAGRRMCVGLPLASRMVHVLLRSLVHSFEWTLPKSMAAEQLDISDKF